MFNAYYGSPLRSSYFSGFCTHTKRTKRKEKKSDSTRFLSLCKTDPIVISKCGLVKPSATLGIFWCSQQSDRSRPSSRPAPGPRLACSALPPSSLPPSLPPSVPPSLRPSLRWALTDRQTCWRNFLCWHIHTPVPGLGWRFTAKPSFSSQTPFYKSAVCSLHPTCYNHAYAATQLVRKRQRANQRERCCS